MIVVFLCPKTTLPLWYIMWSVLRSSLWRYECCPVFGVATDLGARSNFLCCYIWLGYDRHFHPSYEAVNSLIWIVITCLMTMMEHWQNSDYKSRSWPQLWQLRFAQCHLLNAIDNMFSLHVPFHLTIWTSDLLFYPFTFQIFKLVTNSRK